MGLLRSEKKHKIQVEISMVRPMEYGQVQNKIIREFLRGSELLLGLLREPNDGKYTNYELTLVKIYVERIKSAILTVETSDLLKTSRGDRARQSDSNSDHR